MKLIGIVCIALSLAGCGGRSFLELRQMEQALLVAVEQDTEALIEKMADDVRDQDLKRFEEIKTSRMKLATQIVKSKNAEGIEVDVPVIPVQVIGQLDTWYADSVKIVDSTHASRLRDIDAIRVQWQKIHTIRAAMGEWFDLAGYVLDAGKEK